MNLASYILIGIRFIISPLLYYDASDGKTSVWFLIGLAIGFLSDIFDGVIARKTDTVTAHLREVDGRVDVWFFIWIALSAWRTHPETVIAYRIPLLIVFCFQMLAWLIDWIKYRRLSNYHAYSAKAFGLSLFAATVIWFSYGPINILIWFVILSGMVCMLEEIFITLLLPYWVHDISSVFHAVKIRSSMSIPQNQE